MTQLPLPLVRERVFFIGGRSWRSRWLSDVDDAVVTRPCQLGLPGKCGPGAAASTLAMSVNLEVALLLGVF